MLIVFLFEPGVIKELVLREVEREPGVIKLLSLARVVESPHEESEWVESSRGKPAGQIYLFPQTLI